jgi:hypothetical protein
MGRIVGLFFRGCFWIWSLACMAMLAVPASKLIPQMGGDYIANKQALEQSLPMIVAVVLAWAVVGLVLGGMARIARS